MGLDLVHLMPVNKIGSDQYFTVEELNAPSVFLEKNKALICQIELEEGLSEIIYFVEKGYQRKDMNADFYNMFKDGFYFDISDVQKASSYLQSSLNSNLQKLQQQFKKDFIDNFVENESVFLITW